MAGPRIDGVEEPARARHRTIRRGLVAVVVPAAFIASPHANAAGPNRREKCDLITREDEAYRLGTEALPPETGHGVEVRLHVFGRDPRLSHQDVREGVSAQLLPRGDVYGAQQVRREMQMPVAVQLRVTRADRKSGILVGGRLRRSLEVLGPVAAGRRADRRPSRTNVSRDEELEQGRHDGMRVFQVLAVGIAIETQPVVQTPPTLE